jgi:hypothetical protein
LVVIDGVWSAADVLPDGGWFALCRDGVAAVTLLASLLMAVLVAATPRVPARCVAPLVLYVWWATGTQAFPWGFGGPNSVLSAVAVGQVILAAVLGYVFRREVFGPPVVRPAFSWRRSLVAVPVFSAAFLAMLVLGVFTGLADELESVSGGYVRLRPDGIYLLERRFSEGNREVCLSGMMHIADDEFYSDLLPAEDPQRPSIVLIEGVTDEKNLLGEQEISYGNVARLLSVSAQEHSPFMERVMAGLRRHHDEAGESSAAAEEWDARPGVAGGMDFVHADVDVASFHPKTITFIVTVMGLFQVQDLPTFLRKLSESKGPLNDETAQELVLQDILHARNEFLVGEIETSLKTYRRVIVPWGALHLSGVETWLREQDFQPCGETQRRALRFW